LPLMATSTFQPSSLLPTTFAVLSICLSGALGASRWGESVHKPVCESNKLVCFFSARYKKPGSRPGSLGSPLGEKRGLVGHLTDAVRQPHGIDAACHGNERRLRSLGDGIAQDRAQHLLSEDGIPRR